MIYDVRLPGFGGAAVLLRRSVAGDPPSMPGADVWLVDPESCIGVLARPVADGFWEALGRYLFTVAAAVAPERDVPAFQDPGSGLSVDIRSSDEARIGLRVSVVDPSDKSSDGTLSLDFESSRAAVANTADGIRATVTDFDLVDFGELY